MTTPPRLFIVGKELLAVENTELLLDEIDVAAVGRAFSVAEALERLGEVNADGAIIDLDVRGNVVELVGALVRSGKRLIFMSDRFGPKFAEQFPDIACLEKPVTEAALREAVARAFNGSYQPLAGKRRRKKINLAAALRP